MNDELIASLRREVALVSDRTGRVTWADAAATRLLGLSHGSRLQDCAPAGMMDSIGDLLARAAEGPFDCREVCVRVDGRPVTMAFAARPVAEGILLVGTLAPHDFSAALQHVNNAITELGTLQRRADRQQWDLARRNEELERLNRELDDASKGVRALYADLQDKAQSLAGLSEMKSRLVAGVSHEFRTPLNAISGLADLLKSRLDGDLSVEQDRQVTLIKESATGLTAMVDDLLDLSKADAGKQQLRPSSSTVGTLFAALRGLFRAVHHNEQVALIFDAAHAGIELETDEGKIAQILRNLVSNALKFTEHGSVTVAAAPSGESRVVFTVRDTGIGIARDDQPRVFEEFAQLQSSIQDRVRGTGLGLPLARALARVLGGTLTLESEPGRGSLFTLDVPRVAPGAGVRA